MARRRSIRVAAVTVAALVLAGCGNAPWSTEQYSPEPAAVVAASDCLAPNLTPMYPYPETPVGHPPAPEPGNVPEEFEVASVVTCEAGFGTLVDDAGRWSVVAEKHLEGDLSTLLTALAQPSDRAGGNIACTADMEILPAIWLVDAEGRAMRAARPTDACNKSKPGVSTALSALEVVQTIEHRQTLLEPHAALEAGCAGTWTVMPSLQVGLAVAPEVPVTARTEPAGAEPGEGVSGSYGVLPEPSSVDGMRLCRYAAAIPAGTPQPVIPGLKEGEEPHGVMTLTTGDFVSGRMLDVETAQAVLVAVQDGMEAPKCTMSATSFLVLWPLLDGAAAGAPLTVELDGCTRFLPPDRQALAPDPSLMAMLVGSGA